MLISARYLAAAVLPMSGIYLQRQQWYWLLPILLESAITNVSSTHYRNANKAVGTEIKAIKLREWMSHKTLKCDSCKLITVASPNVQVEKVMIRPTLQHCWPKVSSSRTNWLLQRLHWPKTNIRQLQCSSWNCSFCFSISSPVSVCSEWVIS